MSENKSASILPKVKFLTVVWGEKYIERFCCLSLPSFLASGNLPSLAEATRLEIVIMTCSADIVFFKSHLTFQKLKSICPVRFVEIDDLITTAAYGVTLTLAYARPIIASGNEMLTTYFVFMNADFVLANGSLRSLAKHIRDGRSIVLGPSYRAIAEELEPKLEKMVDARQGVLDISSRDLVEMALSHPHRTTIAKTFNQKAFSSTHPNQLFWQVDEHTVLGRYFLIFMLCLKPEKLIESVNCYCDYAFIPELCPSGDEIAMNDSDDFFMLELQSRFQETFMLRFREMSPKSIARSLQQWATFAHRRAADHDIVFHSKDLAPRVVDAKALAANTVNEIRQHLGKPRSHQNHHYWVMGVETWKEHRRKQGLSEWAPELSRYRPGIVSQFYLTKHLIAVSLKARVGKVVRNFERSLVGRWLTNTKFFVQYALKARVKDFVRRLKRNLVDRWLKNTKLFVQNGLNPDLPGSPYMQTTRLHQHVLEQIQKNGQNNPLLIVGVPGPFRLFGYRLDRAERISEARVASSQGLSSNRYAQIVFFPRAVQSERFECTVARLLARLQTDGSLHILFQLEGGKAHSKQIFDIVIGLGEMVGNHLHELTILSTGNGCLYLSNRLVALARHWLLRFPGKSRLLAAVLLAPLSCLSALIAYLANLFVRPRVEGKLGKHCLGGAIQVQLRGVLKEVNTNSKKGGMPDF